MFFKNNLPKLKRFVIKLAKSWVLNAILVGFIVALVIALYQNNSEAEKRGGMKKSKQIGETAKICNEVGGLLFIQQLPDALSIECITIKIEVEPVQVEGSERAI